MRSEKSGLTIAEAARLLHVSKMYLLTLVEQGVFTGVHTTRGGHRQISHAEVLAYKEKLVKAQTDGLERMIEASQCMGLYDEEIRELPLRRKLK
ncbi:helix-turn-helix domain-containing protein [Paraburkholderia caribensis]|uniref:helix-turn-helix domain-containing protein n=1 Tax=Paraburkholderia caribensis TaxID=75105 RepID=UPI0031D1595F